MMKSSGHWQLCFMVTTITAQLLPCDERSKMLSEDLKLTCPDSSGGCTWSHVVNNRTIPIEERFRTTDGTGSVNLKGNDLYSYGEFIVQTTNGTSQCYTVCPEFSDNMCDNCSMIIIKNMTNPYKVELCIRDNINITLTAPPIFQSYSGGSLRDGDTNATLSCSNSKCCEVPESILTNSVIYQCTNMNVEDSGLYYGHVLITCGNRNVEWCTTRVNIMVKNCTIDPTVAASKSISSVLSTQSMPSSSSISISSSNILILSSSTSSSQLSSILSSTPATTLLPSMTKNETSTTNIDGDDDDDTNVGVIVGSILGVIALITVIVIILVITGCYLTKGRETIKTPEQCIDDNGL